MNHLVLKYPTTVVPLRFPLTALDMCVAGAGGGADTAANSLGTTIEAGMDTAKLFVRWRANIHWG